jgi:hypothetical protein
MSTLADCRFNRFVCMKQSRRRGQLSGISLGLANRASMSLTVQVFRRLRTHANHARQQQASEKRQGTKSREVGTDGAAGTIGI